MNSPRDNISHKNYKNNGASAIQDDWDQQFNDLTSSNGTSFNNLDDITSFNNINSLNSMNNMNQLNYNNNPNTTDSFNTNLLTTDHQTNNSFEFDNIDRNFVNTMIGDMELNPNLNGSPRVNSNNDAFTMNEVPLNSDNYLMMNNVESLSSTTDALSNTSYQSPVPISTSLVKNASSLRDETFSPQSFGFSTSYGGGNLSNTISNTLGKSYGSQLGTSLNNLISPSSTYDSYLDSPYGSLNDDRSPLNSPSFKSIGSPSSAGAHLNPKSALSKESKLSRRRELHNAVERRRRDLIKEKIKELGTLIPPTMLFDCCKNKASTKDTTKANKNMILVKSVEYIIYLREILASQDDRLEELQQKIDNLRINNNLSLKSESTLNLQQSGASFNDGNNYHESYNYNIGNNNDNNPPTMYYEEGSGISTNDSMTNLNNFKDSISAFTDNVGIKSNSSKIRFMDFSNAESEPMDFSKLSNSANNLNDSNNNSNSSHNNDNDSNHNGNNIHDNNNNNELPADLNDNDDSLSFTSKNKQHDTGLSPNTEFNNMIDEPTLKFENDADFLDQLLSGVPSNGFNNN